MKIKLLVFALITAILAATLPMSISTKVFASTDVRLPTSDESNTGGFTTSPLWSKVDETTPNDSDYIVAVTNGGGHCTFGFSAFSVPSGSAISNVAVYYRARDASSGANNIRASIKVGGTYYDTTATSNNPGTSFTTYSYAFTTNPKTSAVWTVDDINGIGTNPLQAFGVAGTDFNPDIRVSMVYAQVDYTVPNPAPTTTDILPSAKTVGDPEFTLTVNGTNFISASVVRFAGSDRATTYVSATQLTATILTSDLNTAGQFEITVFNPAPGGGTSNAQILTVNAAPLSLSLSPSLGPAGSVITVAGTGFTPNTAGYVWFDTNGDSIMDAGEPQTPVTSTSSGAIPADVTLAAPAMSTGAPYQVRADIPTGVPIEISATFQQSNVTTQVKITKYDALGSVLSQTVKSYQWLEANLPIQGNGTTHYYHQGPTFDPANLWDPDEMVNIDSRDYGAAKGTDVKDLCNLVGGASAGDSIKIKASDNFNKWFDYEDIYNPEPAQGKLVVAWYNFTYGGYVPTYNTGMRLIFFAETLNPEGKNVFGDWDMHETLPESRWHYYYDGSFWPSSSGLSVQNVFNIEIYQPKVLACDASGNPKESFTDGETLYVKGLGLAASTSYKIWIQNEPVIFYDVLATGDDPSGSQEIVATGGSGEFGPTAIWTIPTPSSSQKYDIVLDNQASGTIGTYDSYDGIDSPGWKGFETYSSNPVPTTAGISPSSKTVGDPGFTMTVNGTNFISASVVRFAGSDRATTYVSSTQLTATILASDLTTAGEFSITVFNPTPGGGTSNAQTFTVNPPPVQTRVPTSDESNTGGFTNSPLWSKVDETTPGDSDYIVAVTNGGGHCTFGFSAFSVPSGSAISNVTVYYRARDASSGANNIRASVKVGGTYYDTTATSNNPSTTFTTYSYAFTTNPKTSAAWTVDDVNGIGTNPLQAFGVAGTDFNPDIRVSMVYAQVNYTIP